MHYLLFGFSHSAHFFWFLPMLLYISIGHSFFFFFFFFFAKLPSLSIITLWFTYVVAGINRPFFLYYYWVIFHSVDIFSVCLPKTLICNWAFVNELVASYNIAIMKSLVTGKTAQLHFWGHKARGDLGLREYPNEGGKEAPCEVSFLSLQTPSSNNNSI